MFFRGLARVLVIVLIPLALLCTIYLYLYPIFHGCAFPTTNGSHIAALRDTFSQHWPLHASEGGEGSLPLRAAPFRLLVLADPQLEGDSSLPNPEDGFLQRLHRHSERISEPNQPKSKRKQVIKAAVKEFVLHDIPDLVNGLRKRLDLFGNDYYLAHIFRSLNWWVRPTHVTVLGDLVGSQWITEEEFEARAWRYWNRVFSGGRRVEDELTDESQDSVLSDHQGKRNINSREWSDRIINIAGNHDVGYAGDVSKARIGRFEKHFGRADWDIRFTLPTSARQNNSSVMPSLHLIVLNDLVLDTPALDAEIQSASYNRLNSIITGRLQPVEDRTSFTLLLTHVPLYKPDGVCVDTPFFDFQSSDHSKGDYRSGGLKEQNHLSDHVSRSGILEGLYGMSANRNAAAGGKGRNGLILTGHDHEGCDVWHYLPNYGVMPSPAQDHGDVESEGWQSVRWGDANKSASYTGVREITLRSMMGEFGGNAGLLSVWFDFDENEWQYDMNMCQLGIQHIWWAVHILDIVAVCAGVSWFVMVWMGSSAAPPVLIREKGVLSPVENKLK